MPDIAIISTIGAFAFPHLVKTPVPEIMWSNRYFTYLLANPYQIIPHSSRGAFFVSPI